MKTRIFLLSTWLFNMLPAFAQTTFYNNYFGPGGCEARATSVCATDVGGYIMAGSSMGDYNAFLVNTDAYGNVNWAKQYQTLDDSGLRSIIPSVDGGWISTGFVDDIFGIYHSIFVFKVAANGDLIWSKILGTTGDDEGMDVIQTPDGNILIAGLTRDSSSNIFLAKLTASGDSVWTKTFTGPLNSFGIDIKQTPDGGFIILSDDVDHLMSLSKLDADGNIEWQKGYGSFDGLSQSIGNVVYTPDGGYATLGLTYKDDSWDVILIKTDSIGDFEWAKTYNNASDLYNGLLVTPSGGFLISGGTFNDEINDAMLINTTEDGNINWAATYGDVEYEDGNKAVLTRDRGYAFTCTAIDEPGHTESIILIKTDSVGNSNCNFAYIYPEVDTMILITYNITSVVTYGGMEFFDGETVVIDGYVMDTVCALVVPIADAQNSANITWFPNPTSNHLYVDCNNNINNKYDFLMVDLTGKVVFETAISSNDLNDLDISMLPNGLYYCVIFESGNNISSFKIIKTDTSN